MADSDSAAPKTSDDASRELVAFLGPVLGTIGTHVAETARAQAHAASVQADASIKLADIHAQTERLQMRHGFTLQLLGLFLVAGIVGAGFYAQRFELVTHALAVFAGGLAGYGVAKRAK